MAELVVGPILRHVGEEDATIWVETDARCEVEVLGQTEPTFCVDGHHYALVCIEGLGPGSRSRYEVRLDGERRWPPADSEFPASEIRTVDPGRPLRVSFGSCRVALPMEPPYVRSKDEHPEGAEDDALHVYAHELMREPDRRWPNLLLLLGDQVYVDEGSPETRRFIRSRRDVSEPPGEEVVDFEEYTRLYRESWREPYVRWLLSTVPTAMIIDDHDISDDWNISRSWKEEMDRKDWWHRRVEAGFMSYWIYQHLGNLSPEALSENETYARVKDSREDAGPVLRDYARRAYEDREGVRWSYRRDLCGTRVIVMDSRGGRVLEEGRRSIFDDEERTWVWGQAEGEFDHLLIATSDPVLLFPRPSSSGGLERIRVRRDLGPRRGVALREASPRRGLRSLGLVRQVLPTALPAHPRGWVARVATGLQRPSSFSPATSTTHTWPRWAFRAEATSKATSTRPSVLPIGTHSAIGSVAPSGCSSATGPP